MSPRQPSGRRRGPVISTVRVYSDAWPSAGASASRRRPASPASVSVAGSARRRVRHAHLGVEFAESALGVDSRAVGDEGCRAVNGPIVTCRGAAKVEGLRLRAEEVDHTRGGRGEVPAAVGVRSRVLRRRRRIPACRTSRSRVRNRQTEVELAAKIHMKSVGSPAIHRQISYSARWSGYH